MCIRRNRSREGGYDANNTRRGGAFSVPSRKVNSIHISAESTLYCGRLQVLYFFFLFSFKIKGREECCVATFYICLFFQNGEPCAWKGYLDSGLRCCSKSTKNIKQLVRDVNLNIPDSALCC